MFVSRHHGSTTSASFSFFDGFEAGVSSGTRSFQPPSPAPVPPPPPPPSTSPAAVLRGDAGGDCAGDAASSGRQSSSNSASSPGPLGSCDRRREFAERGFSPVGAGDGGGDGDGCCRSSPSTPSSAAANLDPCCCADRRALSETLADPNAGQDPGEQQNVKNI